MSWARRVDPLAERYEEIVKQITLLDVVLPRDLALHRDRFIRDWESGTVRDPVFEYAPSDPAGVQALAELAREAAAHGDPWHQLLAEEAEAYRRRYCACASHDPRLVTEATADENGAPDAALVNDATGLLANRPAPATMPLLDAGAAATVLSAVLDAERLDGWTVQLRANMAAALSVRADRRAVTIRTDARLSTGQLLRLAIHEIGTHVFRWTNARRGAEVLCLQLSSHTATEEGLAVWHEQHVAPGLPVDRRFALRVLAVHTALTGSFTDVVRHLTSYADIGTAFDVAARVKRGLVDTAAPGGFIKDHTYLSGFRHVDRHLAVSGGDYELLMSCKWPLRQLPFLKAAGLPWNEQRPLRTADDRFIDHVRAQIDAVTTRIGTAGNCD